MATSKRCDPDLVHELVVQDGHMANPYASFDSFIDKLNSLKPYLVSVAQSGEFTTYMETAEEVGIHTSRQSVVLGTLGLHENEVGNPLLPAVVVQAGDDAMVGEKYFNMVEAARNRKIPESEAERRDVWQTHVQNVREFWQD